jgi:transposase/IS5 family transposase
MDLEYFRPRQSLCENWSCFYRQKGAQKRQEEEMARFLPYNPDQAYLLPPSVKEVLGEGHLCFFIHRVVDQLDLREFEKEYVEEGRPAYAPGLLLKVWLYAYALGMTSSRRLEQRIREDLGFRYLAGGASPDFWTLNAFRKRHGRGLNDVFTQVVELARDLGMGKLGHVAVDSTRVKANASRHQVDDERSLREERFRIRRQIRHWQRRCDQADPDEGAGTELGRKEVEELKRQLGGIPGRLNKLRKSGMKRLSRTDQDSRFVREGNGFVLGYTAEIAVSQDHLILAQQVTQHASDNKSLVPLVEAVEKQCGQAPEKVSADAGFFSVESLEGMAARGIDAYVPDPNVAWEMKGGKRVGGMLGKQRVRNRQMLKMRKKLRTPEGRRIYRERKTLVEPVFGVLKEQRGLRRFRYRGLAAVAVELSLAATAFNLTRLHATGTK